MGRGPAGWRRPMPNRCGWCARSSKGWACRSRRRTKRARSWRLRSVQALAAAVVFLLPACDIASAAEPKQGGILRIYHRDSPASASIHEEATYSINIPFMPVFNNLVMFDQDVPQNSVEPIVPDLAKSWTWSADNKTLTFKLRRA